jgi:hypothetical protein
MTFFQARFDPSKYRWRTFDHYINNGDTMSDPKKQSGIDPELRAQFDDISADFKAACKEHEEEIKEKEEKTD